MPSASAIAKAEPAAKRALELDGESAEAHHAFAANELFLRWDWETAEKESERALALNPGLAELHHLHAYILDAENRMEESLQEDKRCVEMDPFGRGWAYGYALYRAGRFDDALKELPDKSTPSLETFYEQEWQKNVLDAAVSRVKRKLDPQRYQVFDCYVNKEWSPEKVAAAFKISVDQVYLAKHRITDMIKSEAKRLESEML